MTWQLVDAWIVKKNQSLREQEGGKRTQPLQKPTEEKACLELRILPQLECSREVCHDRSLEKMAYLTCKASLTLLQCWIFLQVLTKFLEGFLSRVIDLTWVNFSMDSRPETRKRKERRIIHMFSFHSWVLDGVIYWEERVWRENVFWRYI